MTKAWGQKKRIESLAREMGWAGEKTTLHDFIRRMIGYLPEEIRPDMEHFYVHDEEVPRKANGKPNTLFYQHLQTGRAVLMVLSRLKVSDLRELLTFKNEGRW